MQDLAGRVVVITVAAAVVAALGAAGTASRPDQRGWRQITAGPMHWVGLALGSVLTGLMAYIWLFVGSGRADAERQMAILFWLIIAFGLGTSVCGICMTLIGRTAARWRGQTLVFTGTAGTVTREIEDIVAMRATLFGAIRVEFRDGTILRLDPYAQGAGELIERISARLQAPHDREAG